MLILTALFAWWWCEGQKKIDSMHDGDLKKLKAQNMFFALLTFMPMYFVNAFMKYVGGDYGNYYIYFQRIVSGKEQEVDIAYKVICLIVAKLGLEFQWVYIIFCLISYGLLLACIYKYSKNYAISYLMFFFNGYFALLGLNQIRQFVSVVLVLFAYDYIKKGNVLKYCFLVVLASTFHFTAIIMLPFYWILQKKWKLSTYGILALILLPFNFFYTEVMTWLFATFLPRYLNTNYVTRQFSIEIPYLCVIMATLIICLLYERDEEEKPVFKNCLMISNILALFGSWLPEYKRFIYYFFVVSIVYVTQLVEKEENKKRKCVVYIILIGIYAWYFFRTSHNWAIYPYRSIFS